MYISRFRLGSTNVKDPNPDTTLDAFKAGVRDQFTTKIISGSPNMDLNKAYKMALAIAESEDIRSGQGNSGEQSPPTGRITMVVRM